LPDDGKRYEIIDGELYVNAAPVFERVAEIENDEGGTITTPLLPGFALDVRDVF
jgi:hypothetical protein